VAARPRSLVADVTTPADARPELEQLGDLFLTHDGTRRFSTTFFAPRPARSRQPFAEVALARATPRVALHRYYFIIMAVRVAGRRPSQAVSAEARITCRTNSPTNHHVRCLAVHRALRFRLPSLTKPRRRMKCRSPSRHCFRLLRRPQTSRVRPRCGQRWLDSPGQLRRGPWARPGIPRGGEGGRNKGKSKGRALTKAWRHRRGSSGRYTVKVDCKARQVAGRRGPPFAADGPRG